MLPLLFGGDAGAGPVLTAAGRQPDVPQTTGYGSPAAMDPQMR